MRAVAMQYKGVVCFHGFGYRKMAEGQSALDSVATEFATYSDFLDSQITPTDLYYLEVRARGAPLFIQGVYSTCYQPA